MAAVNPQAFFSFAAEHHQLLVELYQRRDGVTQAELLGLIRRFAEENAPSVAHVLERLRDLGFIDYAPQASAQYEMTRPFAELMASLLREYRLTSVEVIQSYFTAMDAMAAEIDQARAASNGDLLVRAVSDVAEHVERMRTDSRRNREGVILTAMRVKANPDRVAPSRRYEIILRLWTRYLVPLRDMIDTRKAMDASLDRMERALAEADECFRADGAVAPVVVAGQARLLRLRRDVVSDFRESIREIAPLYEELRRENALARGASHALAVISKQGIGALALSQNLGICNWRQQGLFSDTALESYLVALRGYVPTKPPALADGRSQTARQHIPLETFDAAVVDALPIPDALAWLRETFPDAGLAALLRLYGRMHSGRYGLRQFGEVEERYLTCDGTVSAHPMSLSQSAQKHP